MTTLGDALTFVGVPERIREPSRERFVTLKVKGGGAVQRAIKDGKTPVPFTGYRISAGQFIYSRIDARNGAFALVPPGLDGAVVSKDFPIFQVREDRVDATYLLHFLRAGRLESQIRASSFGATNRQRIAEDVLLSFEIPLPAIPEQRRVTAILDHADVVRAKRRQVLAHLNALPQAIFREMFGTQQYEAVPAGVLMPRMRNGLSPATAGTYTAEVLTLSAVTQGEFNPSAVKAGAFAIEPPGDKRVSARDFLMCRGNGNRRLVGAGAYSPEDRPDLVFPDTIIAGTVDTDLVAMTFLSAAWRHRDVRRQIESVARTTNGTYKVNQQTLGGIKVPLPPLPRQQQFAERVDHITRQQATLQRALAGDDELFASLQARAFRGEL